MPVAFILAMTSHPRNQIIYDGCLFHLAWRCHNKDWLFRDDRIKRLYYDLLLKYRYDYDIIFYAYHFMENHIHLIGKIETVKKFSDYFRVVNNLFSRQFNHRMRRRGQVVMERIKTVPIIDDEHLLTAMAYVDLNGVRAGRDKTVEESIWSSYKYYAFGKADYLLTPAPSYLELAEEQTQRQEEYRNMIKSAFLRTCEIARNQLP